MKIESLLREKPSRTSLKIAFIKSISLGTVIWGAEGSKKSNSLQDTLINRLKAS